MDTQSNRQPISEQPIKRYRLKYFQCGEMVQKLTSLEALDLYEWILSKTQFLLNMNRVTFIDCYVVAVGRPSPDNPQGDKGIYYSVVLKIPDTTSGTKYLVIDRTVRSIFGVILETDNMLHALLSLYMRKLLVSIDSLELENSGLDFMEGLKVSDNSYTSNLSDYLHVL